MRRLLAETSSRELSEYAVYLRHEAELQRLMHEEKLSHATAHAQVWGPDDEDGL